MCESPSLITPKKECKGCEHLHYNEYVGGKYKFECECNGVKRVKIFGVTGKDFAWIGPMQSDKLTKLRKEFVYKECPNTDMYKPCPLLKESELKESIDMVGRIRGN